MKIQILSILLFITAQAYSQNYFPMPLDSVFWHGDGHHDNGSCVSSVIIEHKTDGDTIVNSTAYTKITSTEYYFQPCIVDPVPILSGIIRQDTIARKIYVIITDSLNEKILYDFSQNIGDTVNSVLAEYSMVYDPLYPFTITAIDSVLINGVYHRYLEITGFTLLVPVKFIEGVGSTSGFIVPFVGNEFTANLICARNHNQTIYPDSSFSCNLFSSISENTIFKSLKVFPNPFAAQLAFEFPSRKSNTKIIITTTFGQVLNNISISPETTSLIVPLTQLNPSVYFYHWIDGENIIASGKILKTN